MRRLMDALETRADLAVSLPVAKDSVKKCKVMEPAKALALRQEAYRILGVEPNCVATYRNFATQAPSVHGWNYARTTISAAERCSGPEQE
jgi:hypothetical protein